MPSVSPRLVIVNECILDLWESRADGRGHWLTLERTLIDMLAPKRPGAERRQQQRRSNVIVLADYLERRRRRTERRRPPE